MTTRRAASFEAAIAAEPAFAQPHINLAALPRARGDRERARALLDEAARGSPIDARGGGDAIDAPAAPGCR